MMIKAPEYGILFQGTFSFFDYTMNTVIVTHFVIKADRKICFSRTFANAEEGDEQDQIINIFSLASGHLYERFIKIMMLSVIKHTKSPVKFWFLKNYLSPTLKVN